MRFTVSVAALLGMAAAVEINSLDPKLTQGEVVTTRATFVIHDDDCDDQDTPAPHDRDNDGKVTMEELKERADAMREFEKYDTNADGELAVGELLARARDLGKDRTRAQVQERIKAYDEDGDNTIDFIEASKAFTDLNDIQDAKKKFDMHDKNGDGLLSVEELLAHSEELEKRLTHDQIEQWIRAYDADGDGHLNFTEVVSAAFDMIEAFQ